MGIGKEPKKKKDQGIGPKANARRITSSVSIWYHNPMYMKLIIYDHDPQKSPREPPGTTIPRVAGRFTEYARIPSAWGGLEDGQSTMLRAS
jgi:hypothetical protein